MAKTPKAIREALDKLVQPNARGRLIARGLARGMLWRDGVTPEGAPQFPENLTSDLLDFGYGVLALALELLDANRLLNTEAQFPTKDALEIASEAIESAVRRGDPSDHSQGFHLVVCATALHLAGYAARSFSLLPPSALEKNLSSQELALGLLLRRDLSKLREHIVNWLGNSENSDDAIAARLQDDEDSFSPEDAVITALSASFYKALGLADTALLYGNFELFQSANEVMQQVVKASGEIGNLSIWWVSTLTRHLLHELWENSLHVRLPEGDKDEMPEKWGKLRRDFIAQLSARHPPHIDLWPSQIDAASRAIDPTDDLVIALPTSAGKTRIAELCILRALAEKKRTVYVTPLRALSAQVERILSRTFIPLGASVTSLYGSTGATSIDTKTLQTADIVVATPEKLDFALRQDPDVLNDVGLIIFDEGHMIGMGSREIRYEVLIQRLLRRDDSDKRRIVCLSAMFNPKDPYFNDFSQWLRSDAEGEAVHVQWRPTRQRLATLDWNPSTSAARLSFIEGEEAFVPRFFEGSPPKKRRKKSFPQEEKEFCISTANAFARDGHNVLVYSPQRSQVEPLVKQFSLNHKQGYLTDVKPPKSKHIQLAIAIGREWLGDEHPAVEGLKIGVGTHHGSLPRPFLSSIEELLNAKRLPIVVASPTLAQGIDLSCSVLIFRSLTRFDAATERHVPISPAEFANVIGRAGRAYVDLDGIAVLPCFDTGKKKERKHEMFSELVKSSRKLRLVSGLAILINELIKAICEKLSVQPEDFSEYVLNHDDLWSDNRLSEREENEEDDSDVRSIEDYISDLDLALFSLVDPLNASAEELSGILDTVLENSLWKRTLSHVETKIATRERTVLYSRAKWLWENTSTQQRQACFNSGLGRKSGLFLFEQLDTLIDALIEFDQAVKQGDAKEASRLAVAFTKIVMADPFFSIMKPPTDWEEILSQWIKGTAFADVLSGRGAKEQQKIQAFIQDGAVFKLVWAAEAVRVQARSAEHWRADELGDGPAFSLTFGVPTIASAIFCQMGFASRTGAIWLAEKTGAAFTSTEGFKEWLIENNALVSDPEFWESKDHFLQWEQIWKPGKKEYLQAWDHQQYAGEPEWNKSAPAPGGDLRLIFQQEDVALICNADLSPLGKVELSLDRDGAILGVKLKQDGNLVISYFGPPAFPF
jgi:superfamily II DNA/RNA helicase